MKMRILCFMLAGLWIVNSGKTQTLNEYLVMAAEDNPALKAKYNLYLAELEQVTYAGALPDPNLGFGYFISPVETRVGPQQFKLSLSQMFPWKGTLKQRAQAASQRAQIKFEEFMEARNKLYLEVKQKWLALYELEQEIKITRENLAILQTYEPVTRTKYEANLVSLADLVRVQIDIDETETRLELLELKRKPLEGDFNLLLNRPSDRSVEVSYDPSLSTVETAPYDSVLTNQPRLKAARIGLEMGETAERLSGLARKPNLGLGLDYVFVGKGSGITSSDRGKDAIMPMVSLSLPIFGKKNQALIKSSELRTEGLKATIEATEKLLENEWTRAQYALEKSSVERELYLKEIEKTQLLLRVLTTEYTNNNRDFEDLLAAQQRLLALRLAEVKAQIAYQSALFLQQYLTASELNQPEP